MTNVIVCAVLLTGCTTSAGPEPTLTATTGVRGHTVVEGNCPAGRSKSPCPDKPYQARIIVTRADSVNGVADVTSARDGSFSIPLAPGDYTLHASSPGGGFVPSAGRAEVTVPAQGYAELTLRFDSSVR